MGKKKRSETACCDPSEGAQGCCNVEAIVSVDDRGQMVLPKELRKKVGIRSGEKLALISISGQGKICCMALIKADEFADIVKDMLGPMMKEIMH